MFINIFAPAQIDMYAYYLQYMHDINAEHIAGKTGTGATIEYKPGMTTLI